MTIYPLVGQSSTSELGCGSVGIHHHSKNILANNCFSTEDQSSIKHSSSSAPPTTVRTTIGGGDVVIVDMQQHLLFAKDFFAENKTKSLLNDDRSIYTASTASFDSEDDDDDEVRRVSFAESVVTDVWTRPYTPEEERCNLYYSRADEKRFREEYNFERQLSIDPETFLEDSTSDEQPSNLSSRQNQKNNSHYDISHLVVVHKNKFESFPMNQIEKDHTSADNFFDSDSFWSGSIVWY